MRHHATHRRSILAALLLPLALSGRAAAADWPRWRGPNADGIAPETPWNPQAIATPKLLWNLNVGQGYSAVSVKDSRLYTVGNDGRQDTVFCLDALTGEITWKYAYPSQGPDYPGPRATPTVDDTRLFSFSQKGLLLCLDAQKGSLLWQKDIAAEFRAAPPKWGFSGSPVVEGDLLVLNAGQHGIALDKKTGQKVWASPAGKSGYSTPAFYTLNNRRLLALFGEKALFSVELRNGQSLWSHPWPTSYDVLAADPIVADGRVFISSGYGVGAALLDARAATPTVVWQNKHMRNHFSSCVLLNDHLYGIDGNAGGGNLRCLSFKTGDLKWSHNLGFGSLIAVGNRLLILNERGKLTVAEASPAAFREIASATVLNVEKKVKCWTAPVFWNGLIYCRSSAGNLVCVDARK